MVRLFSLFLFGGVAGISSAFLEQRTKDGYNTFDDTSTVFPSSHNSIITPKWNEPYFDSSVPTNVTALVGKSAYLNCKVNNLGNKTVSNCRVHLTHYVKHSHKMDNGVQESVFKKQQQQKTSGQLSKFTHKLRFELQLIGHLIR